MVGTNFPYTKHLPEPGKARVVQIEADPVRAGVRCPPEVPVVGDAGRGPGRAAAPAGSQGGPRLPGQAQEAMARLARGHGGPGEPDRHPIAPQYLIAWSTGRRRRRHPHL